MTDLQKNPPQNILTCDHCKSTGKLGFKKCPQCKGQSFGVLKRSKFLYWEYPLTRYHLGVEKARLTLNKVRKITILILGFNFWFWMGVVIYKSSILQANTTKDVFLLIKNIYNSESQLIGSLFFLGILSFVYFFYRKILEKPSKEIVEQHDYNLKYGDQTPVRDDFQDKTSWEGVLKMFRKDRKNIAKTFGQDSLDVLSSAYKIADKNQHANFKPIHLFAALLEVDRISSIFLRLGIPTNTVKSRVDNLFRTIQTIDKRGKLEMPVSSPEIQQVLTLAYEKAYESHQEYVGAGELILAAVLESESIKEMLYDLNISSEKLNNVIEWVRIRERLHHQYAKFHQSAKHRSKHGMDKAMTAVATPYLNKFSEDLTHLAQLGYMPMNIARDEEIGEIFRIVQSGGRNVLLVGDYGVGKMSIIEGVTEKMITGDVPDKLNDKRLVKISIPSLLSGSTASGVVERIIRLMNEVGKAKNVILFIHNIDDLVGVSTGNQKESLDATETLAEYLSKSNFFTFATISSEGYSKHVVNSSISSIFTKVDIEEMTENQAIHVLESKVGYIENKNKVFFSYDALENCVKFSSRFIQDDYLPGSAIEIMKESAGYTREKKGDNSLVTSQEVGEIVSKKTKIPVAAVSTDESSKLLRLEEEMHKRLIGQNEAVEAVANALRRARAEMRSTNRPIANFLFLGPTGVGKTELAKTIAEIYFGGEERIVRLDMSEYQDRASVYRLIGNAGEKGSGILTEGIRKSPFTLLLLDEIEKADPNILNLFLQVMDDGRLTDSTGRTVDFTNVIIIATSNAGTSFVTKQIEEGVPYDKIKTNLLHGELSQSFKPEFLNRFDGMILFKALDRESIKKIAGLMLKRVEKGLEKHGVSLEITEEGLDYLADVGYDPQFGARPMRRAIQEKVENKLAELILKGGLKRRDVVVLGVGGEVSVRHCH